MQSHNNNKNAMLNIRKLSVHVNEVEAIKWDSEKKHSNSDYSNITVSKGVLRAANVVQ